MERGGRRTLSVPPAESGGWVLVCDDTVSIRLLIRINLELAGFEVLEAVDGESALALLRRHVDQLPAVLILDAQMRPMDGWDAVAEIRGDPALRDLPVVMVTAALQQHEQERSVAAGIDAFVAKPFEPEELVELVVGLAASGRPAPPL
jgi:CheY-like chemotaxis protein